MIGIPKSEGGIAFDPNALPAADFFSGARFADKVREASFAVDDVELHFTWSTLFGFGDKLIIKTLGASWGEEQGKKPDEKTES